MSMFSIDKQTLIGPGHAGRLRVKPYVTCLLCGLGAICSVVECLSRDGRAPCSSLTGITVLCP